MPKDLEQSIFAEHRQRLVSYANGYVDDFARAEEIVQEAFERFNGLPSHDAIAEPVGYLYRIVRNLSLDNKRRKSLEHRYFVDLSDDRVQAIRTDTPSPEDQAIAKQDLKKVIQAMSELPERTRLALEMHRFGGYKLAEIAEHFGISVSRAQALIADGIRYCQKSL